MRTGPGGCRLLQVFEEALHLVHRERLASPDAAVAGNRGSCPLEGIRDPAVICQLFEKLPNGTGEVNGTQAGRHTPDEEAPFAKRFEMEAKPLEMRAEFLCHRQESRPGVDKHRLQQWLDVRRSRGSAPGSDPVEDDAFMCSMLVDKVHAIRPLADHVGKPQLPHDTQERQDITMGARHLSGRLPAKRHGSLERPRGPQCERHAKPLPQRAAVKCARGSGGGVIPATGPGGGSPNRGPAHHTRPIKGVPHRLTNSPRDGSLVPKAHFSLGGVDVDIHFVLGEGE